MPLLLHRAPRADALAEGLAGLLSTPLPDPFAQELVIVPAKGVERWLSQRLSHRLGTGSGDDGVCAGVEFRSPRSLVAEITGTADDDPWAPDALVWALLAVVDASMDEAWCLPLARHLGHGYVGEEAELRRGRRYAVVRRLARLFASYAEQRPTLLADWEAGRDSDGAGGSLASDLLWQAELWRRLAAEVGVPTPSQRQAAVVAELREGPVALPARLSLFGHTRLPRTEVELMTALGTHHDVHLWLPHPSEPLWRALADEGDVLPRADDDSHVRVGHPLLASLGRDLRELERSLVPVVDDVTTATPAASPGRLLGMLQADIAGNATTDATGRALAEDDDSVQVHACHGPARQVEVLREVLLGLLVDHPHLEPRDIVVMCPDIEAYAPLVEASFGLGESVAGGHPGQRLQVRLADRSLTVTNPLLAVAGDLLALAAGRAEASAVLDLLHAEPVRRRLGFTDSELETVVGWVDRAGVRWAHDAAHRADYGLEQYVQNTWRFGLDRVLAGVTMSEDARSDGPGWIGPTLPLDDVGSTDIDLAGRLAEALDRLRRVTDDLTGAHPVEHWLEALARGLAELTAVGRDEEWQLAQVRRELAGLLHGTVGGTSQGPGPTLRLPDVRALFGERLAGRPTRANFRTGTLTVCTMVPMRSVPHRVVCLLGLDDGVFPRSGGADGDDVLARRPLTGERDPRSEDRQLMLDAVMAAAEHLVVTYSGAHETTGQHRPPSVPLGELLDAVDLTAAGGREHVLRRHPLQDFDPANLRASRLRRDGPFSFDRAALAGALAAAGDREAPVLLPDTVLPTRPQVDLELADLVSFLRHPARVFLRSRLDVALPDEGEEVADRLSVDLDGLEQWQVGTRLLDDLSRGRSHGDALAAEWRRGTLPPGRLGWELGKRLTDQAGPVAEAFHAVTQGMSARAVDVDVDLGGGRRLRGTVGSLYGDRLVVTTYSRLGPRQWLEAWVPLLALCATYPGRPWSAGAIGRAKDAPVARIAFACVDGAVDLLRDLVALRDQGLDSPLALPLKTGFAWAQNRRPQTEVVARKKAGYAWVTDRYPGENAEPVHVTVWGDAAPLSLLEDHGLADLATRLWAPVLERAV